MKEEGRTIHPVAEGNEELEPLRRIREQPPVHYTMKIESFSKLVKMLEKFGVEKYESANFAVGGYEWKLSLYPSGDDKRNGKRNLSMDPNGEDKRSDKGFISLYLVLAEESNLPLGAEVKVLFSLSVYNQSQDKYMMVQDSNQMVRRFHAMKREWGFSQFLNLTTFQDAANGYLIDDKCIFGAEIYIMECTGKGESVAIMENPQSNNFTWKIENFSKENQYSIKSNAFSAGGLQWYILLYPKGDSRVRDESLSIFLKLADKSKLVSGQKIFVKYELRVMNQLRETDHRQFTGHSMFSSSTDVWGFPDFMLLSNLSESSKGFILDDKVVVEAQILLLSSTRHYS